jgi:4-amino-4-deoxy-L-arabinose transferase-like glycosyltransferase
MMNEKTSKWVDRYLLIAIMLLASWLRLHYLQQIEHNLDHAYPVWQALRTLSQGDFPLVGQLSGVLFSHPPLTGYLYVPIIMLTQSLTAVYVVVIVLNIAGVYFTHRAGTALLGAKVGLIASAVIAVNPWVIEYSRYSWPPALLAFFVPLVLWLFIPLWQGTAKQPNKRIMLAFFALGMMCQTTLLAVLVLPAVGILTLLFIRRVSFKALVLGSALFILIQVPFFVGLVQNVNEVQSRVSNFADESSESYFRDDAFRHAFRLVSGEDYELARGRDAPQHDHIQRHNITRWFASGVSLLLGGGVLISVLAIISQRYCNHPPEITTDHARSSAIILLIWFFVPIGLMSYNATFVHPYYQLVGIPAGVIFVGWAVVYIVKPYSIMRWGVVMVLFSPFALLMGLNSARFYQETQATPGTHDLGALPLDWGIELGTRIREHLPENGVVFADVDEWTLNSLALQSFTLIRDNRAPDVTIVPRTGGLYIVAYPPESDISFVPAYAERVDALELPDGWMITIDKYPEHVMPFDRFESEKIRGEKWLSLLNTSVEQEGDTVTVTSTWQVENLTPDIVNYTFAPFIHVVDASGERIQIVDGRPIQGTQFRDGDYHIHQMQFTLDGDVNDYSLQLGQFDGLANLNLILITADGEYVPTIALSSDSTLRN